MRDISITIKETSNTKIVKFEASKFLTKHQSFEYNNIDEASNSPLAQQLFYLPFVKKVYLSANFIALERYDIVEWPDVQEEVAEQIKLYLNSGQAAILDNGEPTKIAVTVYAESTPNPSVMKFVANKKLVASPKEFNSIDESVISPMAKELYNFPYVKSIYMDENFISITKYNVSEWDSITLEIREFIKKYIEAGREILLEESPIQTTNQKNNESAAIVEHSGIAKNIVDILEEYVKPAVASDGGNIVFKSYDEATKTVKVILQGACSGCPSSTLTLKNGIENILKEMIGPEIGHVEAVNG